MQLFADSQTHFAAVSEDGRLKIWDVAAGTASQELKERDHLSYRYTSAAWTQPTTQSKKRGSDSALGLLALGTSNGHVVIWDLVKGEVKQTLTEASHGGPVQALAFNPQGSLLYSSSGAKHVLEWSVSTGEVVRKFRCGSGGASALAVSPDGAVLAVGGSSLRTFDLSSGKKSRKLVSGVSSAVTQLRFATAEDGIEASRFLFAATAGARFVNVYDLELTEHDAPALTLSLPSSAEGIFARASVGEAVVAKKSKKSKKSKKEVEPAKPVVELFIGATTPAGALFLWAHKYQQVSDVSELALASKPLPPTLSSAESAGVLLAELSKSEESDKTDVLVARGSLVKPVFETVSPVDESAPGQWKEELEFEEISDALLLKAERAEADSKNGNKRQKVETADDEKTHIPTLSDRRGLANSLAVADETNFEELDNAEEEEESELTLAERVEALREHVENDVTAALSRAEHEANDKPRGTKPDAASLASVLEQALQARDNAMLEYCLRIHDLKTVRRTVSRVSSFRVLPLLEAIVRKMEKSPSRCARLCPWLRSVLLYHTAYLVAQPDLVPSLSALYQLLETRLQAHEQLQRLAGRLTLVLGQIHVNTHKDDDDDEAPAVVYNEGEEAEAEAPAAEGDDSNNEEDEDEEEEDVETEEE